MSDCNCRGETDVKPQELREGEIEAPDQTKQASTNEDPSPIRDPNADEATQSSILEPAATLPAANKQQSLYLFTRLIVMVVAVLLWMWRDVRWKTKKVVSDSNAQATSNKLVGLPSQWMVLTNIIALSAWWVATCLALRHQTWSDFNETQGPTRMFMRRPRRKKPPDKDGRPVGEFKNAQRWFAEIIEREEVLGRKPSIADKLLGRRPTGSRLRYMLLALKVASLVASTQPDITLTEAKELRKRLRKYKRHGQMMTCKIQTDDLMILQRVIDDVPQGLLTAADSFDLIIDTGCTKTGTGFASDFVPGSLRNLSSPVKMSGIAGGLSIKQEGTVRYEVLDDQGELQVLEVEAYLMPGLNCRLLSPQTYFKQLRQSGKDPNETAEMRIKHDKTVLVLENGSQLSIDYDPQTHLPMLRAFKDAVATAETLALTGCITNETNQNLTMQQKNLLRWHFRLGHIGFAAVQWLGRSGLLGIKGETMGRANLQAPRCAACQFGKQGKTPTPTKHATHEDTGSLSKEKLEPGQLIFMDQYESRLPGRAFTSQGLPSSSLKYGGGTLFLDAASGYINVSHQVGQTAAETIESKMKFEREALTCGVTVQSYHTDNGVFTSKEFMRELAAKGQGLKLSGVSAQFQNGAAENSIKIVVRNARTMMIHASLRWPGFAERDLWPMALSHAVHLHNVTPRQETGVSPIEVFTRTTPDPNALRNMHPWGCPVYVLHPKLKDGKKIPKWEPRSNRGQYMGISPMHASTVGLVRNLQTGSITPQFHMVYDDFFETVHSDETKEPKEWEEMLAFNRFKSDVDEEGYVPDLSDEWVSTEERLERQLDRAKEREDILAGRTRAPDGDQALRNDRNDQPPERSAAPQTANQNVGTQQQVRQPPTPPVTTTVPTRAAAPPTPPAAPVNQGRPTRQRKAVDKYGSDSNYDKYYGSSRKKAIATLCWTAAMGLVSCASGQQSDYRYLLALLTDVDTGGLDGLHPGFNQYPMALKAVPGKDPDLPTYAEAMAGPNRESYEEAMVKEIEELEKHKTWTTILKSSVPKGAKILPSTWVLRAKRYPDGRHRKFKARFCVRGDRQVEGIDYTDKYSPVVSWSTVRMLLSLSLHQNLSSRQVDFSNAFVQAELAPGEDIYVAMPKGFDTDADGGERVLKLNRSLYGLVQAPLYWGNHLKAALEAEGFKQSVSDPCMFIGNGMVVLTYVDDVLFFGKDGKKIDAKIKAIENRGLKLTIEEDVYAFLGVEVVRLPNGIIELRQIGLINKVLAACGMATCHSKATPCNQTPLGTDPYGEPVTGKFDYASVVGMLMYLSSNSRPDIQYSVHQCARFTHFPKKSHEDAICRICRYLQGTKEKGLRFKPDNELKLDCYVDADFAGLYNVEDQQDPVCVKSRTGYCLTLGSCPLIWVSKLQTEVALSTTEAEYIALSQSLRDLIPMRRLLEEAGKGLSIDLGKPATLHSTVFEDNNGALSLALSPKISPRTKHIAVKYHHFRESVGLEKRHRNCQD